MLEPRFSGHTEEQLRMEIKVEVDEAVQPITHIGTGNAVNNAGPITVVKEEILDNSDQGKDEQQGVSAASTRAIASRASIAAHSAELGELPYIKEQLEDADIAVGPTVFQHMDSHFKSTQLAEDLALTANSPLSVQYSPSRSPLSSDEDSKKKLSDDRKRKGIIDEIVKEIKNDNEFYGIGTNVACKLRRMDEEQRIYAELLINKVLMHGIKQRLQEETDFTGLNT